MSAVAGGAMIGAVVELLCRRAVDSCHFEDCDRSLSLLGQSSRVSRAGCRQLPLGSLQKCRLVNLD